MTPNYILYISLIACLLVPGPGSVLAAALPGHDSASSQWEDPDYWVQIRNVSIFDEATQSLQENMFVLVVGTRIHKIGKVPMMIFDKDLTYNFDGEGRILMPGFSAPHGDAGDPESSVLIREGIPADLWLIDVSSLEELSALRARPEWSDQLKRENLDSVKLILEDGWVVKDTLPRKRIDDFRLQRVREKIREMGGGRTVDQLERSRNP